MCTVYSFCRISLLLGEYLIMSTGLKRSTIIALLTYGVLLITISSCTNGGLRRASKTQFQNGLNQGGASTQRPSLFELTRVIRSNADPHTLIDLIGDGSGGVGTYCFDAQVGPIGGGSGPSTCQCRYEYENNNTIESYEEPTVYFEGNMIRCRYDSVPIGVTQLKVSIHHLPTDQKSSEVVFDFSGTGTFLDTTSADSFLEVKRFQCRDRIYVGSMFDSSNIYDPFQSDSTRLSYPLNFYSSNLAKSAIALASPPTGAATDDWECSLNPYQSAYWENPNIYSEGGSNRLIYPPTEGQFNRSEFFLARKRSGIFSVPFNSYVAPTVLTQTEEFAGQNSGQAVAQIGYAVRPTPTSNGEVCPTNTPIPEGYRWVKVWAFRGSLPPREYVQYSSEIARHGNFACNPGKVDLETSTYIPNGSSGTPIFRDCDGSEGFPIASPNPQGLASRVLGNSQACVSYSVVGESFYRAGQAQLLFPDTYQEGVDLWKRVGNLGSVNADIPWDLAPFSQGQVSVPSDQEVTMAGLEKDGGQSRFNYVFVTSPVSVMKATMENRLPGYEFYHPFTYRRKEDCSANDPDSDQNCINNSSNRTIYGLWTAELSGDAGANPRGNQFPLCAIQRN